jgi:6-phosphofructokinase 1
MGRHAGWLALEGGESSGAYIILIPEYNFEIEKVNALLMEGRRKGARYEIIVAAEGAKPVGYSEIVREEGVDSFGHKTLGGIGEFVAKWISQLTKVICSVGVFPVPMIGEWEGILESLQWT